MWECMEKDVTPSFIAEVVARRSFSRLRLGSGKDCGLVSCQMSLEYIRLVSCTSVVLHTNNTNAKVRLRTFSFQFVLHAWIVLLRNGGNLSLCLLTNADAYLSPQRKLYNLSADNLSCSARNMGCPPPARTSGSCLISARCIHFSFFIAPLIHIQQLKDACLASQKIRSSYFSHPFVHPYFSADQPGLGCGAISEQLHPPPHRRGGGGGPLRAGGAPARGAGADGRFPGLEQHGQNPGVAKGALEDENEENHWKSTGKQ